MKRLGIIAAGDLGVQLAHLARKTGRYDPVAFFDDSRAPGTLVAGIPVLGPLPTLDETMAAQPFDELIVAIGYRHLAFRQQVYERLRSRYRFATLVDPQRGANVTVLGQMFMIIGLLTYLAVNGHLILLGALANSFQTMPIGPANIDRDFLMSVASWGARIFETGLLVALPAVVALIIVNMALGVVSRAAPALNLFGIGFTIALLCGFFVLIVGMNGIMSGISALIDGALHAVVDLVAGHATGAP